MRDILSRRGQTTLSRLTVGRLLVVFDYDGTLAPLASTPGRARMRATTRRLLTRLARAAPCAVISGRARRDLRHALGDVRLVALVGNHGAEPSERVRPRRDVAVWRQRLARSLAGVRGIWIEDKGLSLSVHYRASPRKAEAHRAMAAAVARLRGARVFGGHDVVNIVSRTAPDKGQALCSLIARYGGRPVLYVGDDETDEAAFACARATRGLAIRVGRTRNSLAAHFVRTQRHVDALLRHLVRLARPSPTPRRRTR